MARGEAVVLSDAEIGGANLVRKKFFLRKLKNHAVIASKNQLNLKKMEKTGLTFSLFDHFFQKKYLFISYKSKR